MISIYEAVVSNTTPIQKKPVPGAVVPQIQPKQRPQLQTQEVNAPQIQQNQIQQSQPKQIQRNTDSQQIGVSSVQQNVNSADDQQSVDPQVEPAWKKYLKYGGLIGAGLAIGGGIYGIANNWDDIKHHLIPGSSIPIPSNEETTDNDNADSETIKNTKTIVRGAVNQQPRVITRQANWVGPPPQDHIWGGSGRIGGPRDILSYNNHRPANQPNSPFGSATLVKQLDQATGRQYYAPRGGYGVGYYGDNSEWADNYSSDTTSHSGIYVRPKRGGSFNPINDYDLGRRSGLY